MTRTASLMADVKQRVSSTPRHALRSKFASLLKQSAGLGGDPEAEFEKSFASLAYTYIKDKAPILLDYLVGFQLMDRSPDNLKAAGVFGCKVGEQWFYLPSIFVNNEIKGQEICYLKNQDLCIPLKENWINYVLGQQPGMLGNGSKKTLQSLGVMQPDYASLASPPLGKYSEYRLPHLEKWALNSGMFQDYAKLVMDPDSVARLVNMQAREQRYKVAGWGVPQGLTRLLSKSPQAVANMAKYASRYPLIGKALDKWYGRDYLPKMTKLSADTVATRRSVLNKTAGIAKRDILGRTKIAQSAPLQILSDATPTWLVREQEKEALLRDGYVIRDNRNEKQASTVIRMEEFEEQLTNPSETGIYDLLVDSKGLRRCLILHNPHSRNGRLDGCTAIALDGSKKDWCNLDKSLLFVQPVEENEKEQWQSWYKSLSGDGTSLQDGGVYVVVAPGGSGTVPFRVEQKLADGAYQVNFLDYFLRHKETNPGSRAFPVPSDGGVAVDQVRFNQREGSRLHSIQNTLYLPAECKVIRLSAEQKEDDAGGCSCSSHSYGSTDQLLTPSNLVDVRMQIHSKTAELQVINQGSLLAVNRISMSKTAGILHLVREHGLRESAALALVAEAGAKGSANVRVKYAQELPMMLSEESGNSFPMHDPQQYGASVGSNSGAASVGTDEALIHTPLSNIGQRTQQPAPDADLLQLAQQSAQGGDKELFDTASLGSLLKETNEDQLISEFVSDWLGSLDKLGRMILVFYWHNEELAERFGEKDLPRLEDVLRNAFDVLGDVVLFVQEKTVEPLGYADAKLGPDISDAGR